MIDWTYIITKMNRRANLLSYRVSTPNCITNHAPCGTLLYDISQDMQKYVTLKCHLLLIHDNMNDVSQGACEWVSVSLCLCSCCVYVVAM